LFDKAQVDRNGWLGLTAGVAEAQAPTVTGGTLKKEGVRVYNLVASSTAIVGFEVFFGQANTDGDFVVMDETAARVAGRVIDLDDIDNLIGLFNSTVKAYEAGRISVVAGTTTIICLVHESGPASKFSMVSSAKAGSGIAAGGVRGASPFSITEVGAFDLYGPVDPEFAGLQERLQRIAEAKRR